MFQNVKDQDEGLNEFKIYNEQEEVEEKFPYQAFNPSVISMPLLVQEEPIEYVENEDYEGYYLKAPLNLEEVPEEEGVFLENDQTQKENLKL